MADALALLREMATRADDLAGQVFASVTPEQATWQLDGSSANRIAPTFFHVYYAEDRIINEVVLDRGTFFETRGWRERLGVDPAAIWAATTAPDLEQMRAYAAEVHAATREVLPSLDDAALGREVEGPRGRQTVLARLGLILVTHKMGHIGEIAALLGCQGVKGFPV